MVNAAILNDTQKSTLGPGLAAAAQEVANTLSGLLTKPCNAEAGEITGYSLGEVAGRFGSGAAGVKLALSGAASGGGALLLNERDACLIADLMIGQDGSNPPESLTDLHLSAVSEVGSQVSSALAGALGSALGKKVSAQASELEVLDQAGVQALSGTVGGEAVAVEIGVTLEGFPAFPLLLLLAPGVAQGLASTSAGPAAAPAAGGGFTATAGFPGGGQPGGPTTVQPAQMAPMPPSNYAGGGNNIELIMDVPLQITVELGRTHKTVREILSFGSGSVVELDKLAGEPVDILVNEKPIAKGEVVVIDENFGIRITEILGPRERIAL